MRTVPGPAVRAIETAYRGFLFRSRLEARWAVFFDTLGVRYEYEPEGFDLGDRGYLPDFWLPEQQCYAEIKPGSPTPDEVEACEHLAVGVRQHVALLCGQPWPGDYQVVTVVSIKNGDYLPAEWGDGEPVEVRFPDGTETDYAPRPLWNRGGWWQCPVCLGVGLDPQDSMPELFHCDTCDCTERERWLADGKRRGFVWHKGFWDLEASPPGHDPARTPALLEAYTAARSARFEHGESGAPARRGRRRFPLGWSVADPPTAWGELRLRVMKEWFHAPEAVRQKMKPQWGAGTRAPQTETEAQAILADLARFAAEPE